MIYGMNIVKKKLKTVEKEVPNRDQYTVVLEDLRSNFRVFGEALAGLSERVDKRFDGIDKKLDSHSEMIAQLMLDVNEIKSDLKQKVNRDEFAKLEKRVIMLEQRLVSS